MSTVINNPSVESDGSGGMGFILGIIALLVLGGIFLVYLLPQLRATTEEPTQTTIEVNLPPVPVPTPTENTTPWFVHRLERKNSILQQDSRMHGTW